MISAISSFADYLALSYHEARNVRHLVSGGFLERAPYRLLIDGMSENRGKAWRQVQQLRAAAAKASSAIKAGEVFSRHFAISLEALAVLSENPHWKDTERGGNKWAEIDRAVIRIRNAIDQCDEELTAKLLEQIPLMCHNTGRLDQKLNLLDHDLET